MSEEKIPWRKFSLIHGTFPRGVEECGLLLSLLIAGVKHALQSSSVMMLGRVEEVFAELASVQAEDKIRQSELFINLMRGQPNPSGQGSVLILKDPLRMATAGLVHQYKPKIIVFVLHRNDEENEAVAILKTISDVMIFELVLP